MLILRLSEKIPENILTNLENHLSDSLDSQNEYYYFVHDLGVLDSGNVTISDEEANLCVASIMNSENSDDDKYALLHVLDIAVQNGGESLHPIDLILQAQWEIVRRSL